MDRATTEEQRLASLSDEDLLSEWKRQDLEQWNADLLAGEMERRNFDD